MGSAPVDLCVLGLGYIGLPTAAMFASGGLSVRGVDVHESVVDAVNAGAPHIVEPGLDDLVASVANSGSLSASVDVVPSDVFIIAVPTPFCDGHKPDLAFVEAATRSLTPYLRAGDLIVLESTSPIGATERVAEWVREERPELVVGGGSDAVAVAYCPERVLPGNILHELVHNDRIIGGLTSQCAERASAFYQQVVAGDCRTTTARTAELAKLTENAFRDVNIAFANELSLVADEVDVNVWELIELANLHPRVHILQPGPGVGGHCIAVDPWFIADASANTPLIETARNVNDSKPAWVADRVVEAIEAVEAQGSGRPTIACLGLAYKPDIDDLRESPAIKIVQLLAERSDARVLVVEPNIDSLPSQLQNTDVEFVDLDAALDGGDIIVGLVPHHEFREVADSTIGSRPLVDAAGIFTRTREVGRK